MEDMNSIEEDLGVMEERDFAPEERRFFKILIDCQEDLGDFTS